MYNKNNNICLALRSAYQEFEKWERGKEFFGYEKKLIKNLYLNLQLCNPLGKYVTSKLEDFKKMEDPTYTNQKDFFEKDKDYIEEFLKEVKELPKLPESVNVIDEKEFFKEPDDSYRRYELVKYYAEVYRIAKYFECDELKPFMNSLKNAYHMAFRMCKKLDEYKEKYPFKGDKGMWEKDRKMNKIVEAVEKFKKDNSINENK